MSQKPPSDLLTAAIDTIYRWDNEEYNKNAELILEEQPYLMRFILSLTEDFEEQDIEFFVLALMSVQLGFKMRGIPLNTAKPEDIEKRVKAAVVRYDELDEREEISLDDIFVSADNPRVLNQLFDIYYDDFLKEDTIGMAEVMNILLTLEIVVGAVEGSTIETPNE
ncbi:MAG: hypothetical protein LAT54_02060 [Cryomorphaceae bacterium]|nr:hypothetical protein [Cryomorphaceae bacterium]